jgi:eukaryotic-like serine/threonine-protein kinase
MNQKAHGPNGRHAGAAAGDNEDVVAELVIAYDEALRTGNALPDDTATVETLDPKVRERLSSAKDCLRLIERVRQLRRQEAQEPLSGAAASFRQESAYTAGGTIHRIGRFEIVRELGRGSHGIVFLARDPALSREIALKVPRPEAILTPQLRSRFLREGKAAARLNHPNILPVHEAGEAGPICYLVQSYCSGPSLAAWLAQQNDPVPCEVAVRIVAELADGVDHAHRQGILHRDIKPANVMLEIRGERAEAPAKSGYPGERGNEKEETICDACFVPKLTDFGLAKALDDDPNATATLGAIGTATYMPPEQARGEQSLVGPRSDVYSLGAMLYELLTRRPPIAGVNQLETLRLIVSEDPRPLRELRGDVPRELEAICLKSLEKSPDARYQTAADLAADLRRFLAGETVTASLQGRFRRMVRRLQRQPVWVLIGAATITILASGLLSSLLVIRADRTGTIAGQTPPPPDSRAEYLVGIEHVSQGYFDAVATRGDVKRAVSELDAFLERHRPMPGQADHRGFEWHYLWRLCHPDKAARPFPKLFDLVGHKGEVYFVTFSPDGKRIATSGQDHTGRIWDAETGRLLTTLTGHTDDVNWICFVGQSRFLTASDDCTVRIWEGSEGKLDVVLSTKPSKAIAVEVATNKSRNAGRVQKDSQIVCGDDDGRLHVWDWATRQELKVIPAHASRIESIARIRGEDQWITVSGDGTAKEWNSSNWTSGRLHVIDSALGGVPAGILSAACNAEGTLVALAGSKSSRLADHPQKNVSGTELGGSIAIDDLLTGNRWLTLVGPQAGKESVRFYPNQCLLASAARGNAERPDSGDVILSDPATQTFWSPCGASHPECWCVAFSPDGTRFATAATDGVIRVWDSSCIPNGTRLEGFHHFPDPVPRSVSYSPDGRRLLVSHGGLGPIVRNRCWIVWDVSGKRPHVLAERRNGDVALQSFAGGISPDGRFIALDETEIGEKDNIVRSSIQVLQADSLREVRRLGGYYGFARRIFLSPQGTSVVAATGDLNGRRAQLNFWFDSQVTRAARTWESNRPGDFWATTVSPDRRLLATNRNQVEIYEFPSLRLVSKLPVDLGRRPAACFSPDGRLLAVSGDDGTIHVFRPRTGTRVGTFVADGHAALSMAFSPDGSRLAAGLDGGARIDLWHVATGKRLTSMAMPTDLLSVDGLAFAPDGRTLAAAGARDVSHGSVFLFPLEPVETPTVSSSH